MEKYFWIQHFSDRDDVDMNTFSRHFIYYFKKRYEPRVVKRALTLFKYHNRGHKTISRAFFEKFVDTAGFCAEPA